MRKLRAAVWRSTMLAAGCLLVLTLTGCSRSADASLIGTFHMGERVQAGPLTYTVLEQTWRPALTEGGRAPVNRFLFLRMSVTNAGSQPIAVPGFTLQGPDGKSYPEVTENVQDVTNWMGILRNLQPSQTLQGVVIFDAPIGKYKLVVSDGGQLETEKHAHIEIPAQLE